jgi:hypothetical protein
MLEAEAKERMTAGVNQHASPSQIVDEGDRGEARERQAARRFGGGGNISTTAEAEAKERQRQGRQRIDDPSKVGQASDHAAKLTETNRQYVSDAKKLADSAWQNACGNNSRSVGPRPQTLWK